MSRFARTWVFGALTAGVLWLSAWLQAAIHSEAGPEAGFHRAVTALLLLAFCLLGVGVYLRMTAARRQPALRREAWFGVATGGVLLCVMLVCFVMYGNLPDTFPEEGYTASNLLLILLALLPAPFVLRIDLLALPAGEEPRARQIAMRCAGVLLTIAYLVILAAVGFRLLTYTAPAELS